MPNLYRLSLAFFLFFTVNLALSAQQEFLPPDTLCLTAGGPGFNIATDDFPAGVEYFVEGESTQCYRIDQQGNITIPEGTPTSCCGPQPRFVVLVNIFGADGNVIRFFQEVNLTIKCPKPDCGLVDLEQIPQPDSTQNPDLPPRENCINACENSTATYLFSENPALTYEWEAVGAAAPVNELPGLPGQIQVTWGTLGSASLTVNIYDANGNLLGTRSWCVNLTEAPIADFTASGVACLDQDVYFTNTSTGAAATYDWDFGDGNTAQNVMTPTVAHAYDTPGTYTVTLVATSNGGLNPDGSQACCCVDSISYDITIDPDPGPAIYWISTLCEGDTSKYWTDATGCDSYSWGISGNGDIISDPTQSMIMVVWGEGPSGTLELNVTNCDSTYCPTPTVAVVPIISTNGVISGPTEVCGGETANYALPKWLTTEYTWILPGGGTFNGSNNGHTTSITWPTTPGTYQIVVEYGSAFLAGLPGHEGDDCYGRAVLEVTVLDDFSLSAAPNPVCVDGTSFFNTFSSSGPTNCNWSVTGFPGLDVANQSFFSVSWSSLPGPGVYTIVAEAVNQDDYCVGVRSITVVVKDAVTPVIVGPLDYCIGDSIIYSILSPTPGYTYNWSISTGTGSVPMGQGGPTATIVFTSATATVSVTGQDSQLPNCVSDPALLNAEAIGFEDPITVTGPPACTNSLADYTISTPQHASATYAWSVSPATHGSVVMGADATTATVQWNDSSGAVIVQVAITICDETRTYTLPLTLNAPVIPVITQVGELCPNGSIKLYIDSTQFDSILWDLGANAGAVWGPNAGNITVFEEGSYVVNTIDLNGCPGVARYRVDDVPGPNIDISATDVRQICVNSTPYPANPILSADTDPANTIEWFCGPDSQGPASVGNTTFSHVWTNVPGTFVYTARVTDPATGCTEVSDPLLIWQVVCCDSPYVSDPISQIHDFTATRQSPNCDMVDLVANFSPDSVAAHSFSWNFLGAETIYFGGDADTDSMTIRLPGADCYDIFHNISVWAFDYDTTFTTSPTTGMQIIDEIIKVDSVLCTTSLKQTVCNPLFADFDKREECGEVQFTDLSEFDLPVPAPAISYNWDFGDGGTSTGTNPIHPYAANGTYTVTLTITDGDCVSTATMVVEVTDRPDSDFMVSPNPVCYGQPATFTGTGTNVIEWKWNFGDGATFNGNGPQHTFLPLAGFGDYDVTLTTTNRAGCVDTIVQTIDVNPTPAKDTIEASNGFIICDGETTTLSVDNIPGLDYLWSTGATTASITVSTAGIYGVTITDGTCTQVIDPVEVQLIPLPDVSWIGNPFICDNGSTKLTALAGGGHSYLWENVTTGQTVAGMMYTVPFSFGNPVQDIILTVTNDAYGCTAQAVITVQQVASPAPDAQITAGGSCEGDGSLIEVINPEPDVVYSWNTGATGLSIFTYSAGTYTVIATNTITGCVGTDQVTINPLPDICIVPTGCYEICDPYTIYAPLGDYSYAWYFNGSLVSTASNLVVTTSGSYSVTVTDNVTGCASVSDSLYLEVIDCDTTDCDNITTRLSPSTKDTNVGSCCFDLYYDGLPAGIHAIQISSADANLALVPGSNHPDLGFAVNAGPSTIQLAVNALGSLPIPTSLTAIPAATFCPIDPTATPQQIIVDYLDIDGEIVCSDTLFTECPVEPDCAYVTSDSLYCSPDGELIFTFTVCNPLDADFAVGYLQLSPNSPAAATALPPGFPVSPAIAAGDCRTFTFTLPALTPGDIFAYTIVAHSADPNTTPSALCCSDPNSDRKLEVPDCDPCDNIGVRDVRQSEDGCCYDIVLSNDAPAPYTFDGIDLCLLSGDGTLTVYSSLGDPLVGTVGTGGQTVSISNADGTALPNGFFRLPTICIEGAQTALHQIEIKWISKGGVVCRDTIEVFCSPPCGFLTEQSLECDGDVYKWKGTITNTSPFTMSAAYIEFDPSLGLSAYNTTIVFGSPLSTGQSENIVILIGSPAGPLDEICFTVTLHETGPDDLHLNCCQFEVCIELPDCAIEKCSCDNPLQFREDVNMGFDSIGLPLVSPLTYRFDPRADFTGCDSIVWSVRSISPPSPWSEIGDNMVQDYTFPAAGRYQVWMRVYRFADSGELCTPRNSFITYNIGGSAFGGGVIDHQTGIEAYDVAVFPNPAEDVVQVVIPRDVKSGDKVNISLHDINGRMTRSLVFDRAANGEPQTFRIDVSDLPSGVYLLRGTDGTGWTRRFVKR